MMTGLLGPWLIFFIFLDVAGVESPIALGLQMYWASGILGGLIILTAWLSRLEPSTQEATGSKRLWVASSRRKESGTVRVGWLARIAERPSGSIWPLSFGMFLFLAGYSWLFLTTFTEQIYPNIPEQFGGGRPRMVRLLIAPDAQEGLRELELLPASRRETGVVRLLFQGSSFYVVESSEGLFVLDNRQVIGLRLIPERA